MSTDAVAMVRIAIRVPAANRVGDDRRGGGDRFERPVRGHEVGGPGRIGEAELQLEAFLGHAQLAQLPRRLRRDPDLGGAAEREPAPADGLGDASDGKRSPLD